MHHQASPRVPERRKATATIGGRTHRRSPSPNERQCPTGLPARPSVCGLGCARADSCRWWSRLRGLDKRRDLHRGWPRRHRLRQPEDRPPRRGHPRRPAHRRQPERPEPARTRPARAPHPGRPPLCRPLAGQRVDGASGAVLPRERLERGEAARGAPRAAREPDRVLVNGRGLRRAEAGPDRRGRSDRADQPLRRDEARLRRSHALVRRLPWIPGHQPPLLQRRGRDRAERGGPRPGDPPDPASC